MGWSCLSRPRCSAARGQSVVEFVLILPAFLLLFAVTLDLGRLAFSRVTLDNAAREGAFQGAVTPVSFTAGQPCPSNGASNLVVCRTQLEALGSPVTITPDNIAMECNPADCSTGIGNTVTVTVTGHFTLLTPLLAPFSGSSRDLTITSMASAQIETLPTPTFVPPWATPTPNPSASGSPSPAPTSAGCQVPNAGLTFSTSPNSNKAPVTLSMVDTPHSRRVESTRGSGTGATAWASLGRIPAHTTTAPGATTR